MLKIIVKDGKGRRIVTEIKRPDPIAILILDENVPTEVEVEELHLLITLGYVALPNVKIIDDDGTLVGLKAVYQEAVVKSAVPIKVPSEPVPEATQVEAPIAPEPIKVEVPPTVTMKLPSEKKAK